MSTAMGLRRDSTENNDAEKLASLLQQQRNIADQLSQVASSNHRNLLEEQLQLIRNQCIEMVDRYFRQVLHPILLKRFPGKLARHQCEVSEDTPVHAVAQFTQLLNDFFVQVLTKSNDPFWRKQSAIELRNYASIAISNRGLRDALRRRKKHESPGEEQLRSAFEDQLAYEVDRRFTNSGVDPADAIDVIEKWERYGDRNHNAFARLLRLRFVAGMTTEQVAGDMGLPISTAYRHIQNALDAVRGELENKT